MRYLRNERGQSVVELALLLPLFVALVVGSAELATLTYDSIEVSNAAYAGASYGVTGSNYAFGTTGIVTAAQSVATDFGTQLTVTPMTYYACSAAEKGTQYTGTNQQVSPSALATAISSCTGRGNRPLEFMRVVTRVAVTPPIRIHGLPATVTLSGTSTQEIFE